LFQVLNVFPNALAFSLQIAFNRFGKTGVCQPVRAGSFDGQERTRHFVFALGTAFKAVNLMLYAPFQGLVVAGLKVQAVHALQGTPIAAVGHTGLFF
jgi:hypothetical protein